MEESVEDHDYSDQKEVKDVFHLLEKNVDCTNYVITQIDDLIENKVFSEPLHNILTLLRNTCAINVMNINRLIK